MAGWFSQLNVRKKINQIAAISIARPGFARRKLAPYALLLPGAILLILLNLVNSGYGVYLSFLDFSYLRVERLFEYVGFKHYLEVLTDPTFHFAVQHTMIWSVIVVPGAFLIGLLLALLLNEQSRAKALFRTLVLMPWTVPLVVAAAAWYFIFAPGIGPLDDLLFRLGMPGMKYMNWLGSMEHAFPIVMGVQVWRWAPFFAITLLAGLQAIPSDLYDAAEIDGAGMLARFQFVTLPLLRPVAAVVLLQGLIWSFHNFTLVFVMTKGGPAYSTELITIYLWRQAFPLAEVARGAAVGTILVLILSILGTLWVLSVLRREVTE